MKTQFYIIKGTLARCSREDLITADGTFIENKLFFLRDFITREFKHTYRLQCSTPIHKSELDVAIDKYMSDEINYLLQGNLIYKLSQLNHELDFSFQMYVKTATMFDLFYCPNHLKINTVYYNRYPNGTIDLTPSEITEYDDPKLFLEKIEKGFIVVPSKKQLFEPYKIQKAS